MYLKNLTMKGFKSFADATTLDLETGVTVVVGPNGSGKSNVVDAIAWVLGAQAPSAVRSQKMDDVIFAGTANRSALGRAEVALTIDNTSGMLPIEFNEVTITRTLFRTGDSEYAINGTPCRLLDIQELLSDSGVGRQQHVIISQGQIDAVLNAKPEDRRGIIEEAAGVLKYRKRKEKSERRLTATEANLTRLADLLREVRRQLRPLERQADAARRHGAVVAELTALRIHLAGRELSALRTRLDATAANKARLSETSGRLNGELARLDTAVMATESQLTAMGGDDLGDDLAAFESLHERARGLTALLDERRRGLERERNASMDQGVVASLEAEASRLRSELDEVLGELETLAPERQRLAGAEEALAAERQAFDVDWAEGVPAPSGAAAELRGELSALSGSVQRIDAELERQVARQRSLTERAAQLGEQAQRLRTELGECEATELPLVSSLEKAEKAQATSESTLHEAEQRHRASESELHATTARVEALALALDEARARAGAERLVGIAGVLGTVLDLVAVDDGFESAFEAAAGEALAAVVVDSSEAGRAALATLSAEELSGSVLALYARSPAPSPPAVGMSLRSHVRALRHDVEPLLDALIGGVAVAETIDAAIDAGLAHPDAVIVTRSGDRIAPGGWRTGAGGAGATGAALDEARRRLTDAQAVLETSRTQLSEARSSLEQARRSEAELSRQLDDNDGRMTAAADALARVESQRRDALVESESLAEHRAEIADRRERDHARVLELEAELPRVEAAEMDLAERSRRMAEARGELEAHAGEVGSLRAELDVRSAGLSERRTFLTGRLDNVEERLERSAAERDAAATRREELDRRAVALDALHAEVARRQETIDVALGELRQRRQAQSDAARAIAADLDGLRRKRSAAETELVGVREQLQRIELEDAETRLRIETAVENLRRELDCEPQTAIDTEAPPLDEGTTPVARARQLERELRLMGPINPLALEEFEALNERHEFIASQLDDVKATRRELTKVIRAIDEEIVQVFAGAFADVSTNFEHLFSTLFPGGVGRLRLTMPDDLLSTGIEVEAKPSGKNVKKLSLLSGGERSLTALAFLFAIFRSRPSPFYVMDEVEAALDDVNLHRFLGLVEEFRNDAQLVIVSHQKRTMEAADCLYGVTMQPGGSSKVVSEKVSASG